MALGDNPQAKTVLAQLGYTAVSDAALETIRRNKVAQLEEIRRERRAAEFARRSKIAEAFLRERDQQPTDRHTDTR